jgi:mediator of RNA polymerase II transcription subunit 6
MSTSVCLQIYPEMVICILETMEVAAHADDYNGSFRDTVWLQSFPLNAQTVLHYFALSPFYDRSCNNERLKMQRLGLDQLKNLRGVEYELLPNAAKQLPQQLYIIRKQRRSGRTQVEPLAIYYVLDGTVYQAPNIHAMLTSRLVRTAFVLGRVKEILTNCFFATAEKMHLPSEQGLPRAGGGCALQPHGGLRVGL